MEFTIEAGEETSGATSLKEAVAKAVTSIKLKKAVVASIYDSRYRLIRQYMLVNNTPQLTYSEL